LINIKNFLNLINIKDISLYLKKSVKPNITEEIKDFKIFEISRKLKLKKILNNVNT